MAVVVPGKVWKFGAGGGGTVWGVVGVGRSLLLEGRCCCDGPGVGVVVGAGLELRVVVEGVGKGDDGSTGWDGSGMNLNGARVPVHLRVAVHTRTLLLLHVRGMLAIAMHLRDPGYPCGAGGAGDSGADDAAGAPLPNRRIRNGCRDGGTSHMLESPRIAVGGLYFGVPA